MRASLALVFVLALGLVSVGPFQTAYSSETAGDDYRIITIDELLTLEQFPSEQDGRAAQNVADNLSELRDARELDGYLTYIVRKDELVVVFEREPDSYANSVLDDLRAQHQDVELISKVVPFGFGDLSKNLAKALDAFPEGAHVVSISPAPNYDELLVEVDTEAGEGVVNVEAIYNVTARVLGTTDLVFLDAPGALSHELLTYDLRL